LKRSTATDGKGNSVLIVDGKTPKLRRGRAAASRHHPTSHRTVSSLVKLPPPAGRPHLEHRISNVEHATVFLCAHLGFSWRWHSSRFETVRWYTAPIGGRGPNVGVPMCSADTDLESPMQCPYCDRAKPESEFTTEHILSRALGGALSDEPVLAQSV